MAGDPAAHGLIADRRRLLCEPPDETPGGRRAPVLLVGLGDIGLAVLRHLLASGQCEIFVFDPLPVEGGDVGPFYGLDEMARDKAQIVWTCLGPRARSIVHVVPSDRRLDANLGPIVDTVDVVVCEGDQRVDLLDALDGACRRARVPLVPVDLTEDGAFVGPVLRGDGLEPLGGCFLCARQHRAQRDPFEAARARGLDQHPGRTRGRPLHDASVLATVAAFVVLAMKDAVPSAGPPRSTRNRQIRIGRARHTVALDVVPAHHRCRRCFPAADRDVQQLRHETEGRWARAFHADPAPATDLARLWPRLLDLVGEDNGIFRSMSSPTTEQRQRLYGMCRERAARPQTNAIANAHRVVASRPTVVNGEVASIVTEGLDFADVAVAGALAMVEGLERLFALDEADAPRIVHRRHADVSSNALDPRQFPLFAPEQYAIPGFGLLPFDPNAVIPWVWGMRLGAERPVLVPADLVYASASPTRIYRANSNGAACHSSFHEAVLNGIYETIERDALMVVWLNRLSMPRVDPGPADADPWSVRAAWADLALECELVDITTDLGVPVLLGILRDRLNPDLLLVDPVASLSPGALLRKLYKELVQFSHPYLLYSSHYRRPVTRSADGDLVVDFADHVGFYQASDKHIHAAFLTASSERRSLGAGPHWRPRLAPREAIAELVTRLGRHGHEVIVVDCTVPLLEALGLCAVKVLIPGLQPLNAGHRYRALGGRRVLEAPRRMGMAGRHRTLDDLNPWPHPFW